MREKDVTAKEYLENENRIADLINVAYHGGQQVVRPEHVHTRKCRSVIKKRKNSKRESNEITRDIASVGDYLLHIIDVRRYSEYEKFTTDLQFVFGFLQRDQSGEALQGYLEEHKEWC